MTTATLTRPVTDADREAAIDAARRRMEARYSEGDTARARLAFEDMKALIQARSEAQIRRMENDLAERIG